MSAYHILGMEQVLRGLAFVRHCSGRRELVWERREETVSVPYLPWASIFERVAQ